MPSATHAGEVNRSTSTLEGFDNQWCVWKRAKFFALKSNVATTARRAKVYGYAYIMVFDLPPNRCLYVYTATALGGVPLLLYRHGLKRGRVRGVQDGGVSS